MPNDREIAISLMTDAAKAVGKSRGPQHGEVSPSFQMIADFWSTHINHAMARRTGIAPTFPVHLTPWDVAQMMSMLKKARALYGDATLGEHYADDIGCTGLAGGLAGASGSTALVDAVGAAIQEPPAALTAVQEADAPQPEQPASPIPEFLTREKKKSHA